MATFTMQLKTALEYSGGIGLDCYPIFRESHRPILNKKIIDHYWNQEIGFETVELFRLAVRRRMHEIMPYYNQLYESELIKIDPINTVDLETETEGLTESTAEGTSESTSNTESKSRSVQSDFPQTQLAPEGDYATAAADSASDTDAQSEATENSSSSMDSKGKSRTTGVQGSQADMLMRFRESFLNIDLMVITELSDCFMGIWNNHDNYTQTPRGIWPYVY